MPRDSQGNFTNQFNWVDDAANGIGIEAQRHQDGDDDQAQGLTDSLDRKGRGGMQANFLGGNFKLTQIADGTDASDGVNIGQVQNGEFTVSTTETGSANAYVINLTPAITSYTTGLIVRFTATNANTGASTLQVNGLTPAPALQWQGKDLAANTITAGMTIVAQYTGSAFDMVSSVEVLPPDYGGTGQTSVGNSIGYNVGTAVGELVELIDVGSGTAGWPAVDGRNLTGTINQLTTENTLDPANDLLAFYDNSATGNRKTIIQTLIDEVLSQITFNPYVWVRFDGTTGNIIGQSGVSGVTRNATGDYTVNFLVPWASAGAYVGVGGGQRASGDPRDDFTVNVKKNVAPTASAITMVTQAVDGTRIDPAAVHIVFNGNQ